MLDAVRICGRWVCRHVLARLTARASVEQPPARRELVKSFCRSTNWLDRQGRPCLSSANIALRRLEKWGWVRLPPPMPRRPRGRARQLWDDGLALPPLPRVPGSAERIDQLRLYLLSGAEDSLHGLWNRLVGREHPLKRSPLFGTQLRYLIVCGPAGQEGFLGAFGFGPASFHLECRDRWIGWDLPSRQAHLPRVIGLSRFLIRPGLRCANLASRCYRLALSQVARDWEARYGVRPVLVETFVDRSTQSGVSLSASNWRRLGQSQGRGRSSPSTRVRPQSVKDVWVYELAPQARERLQERPRPRVTPRSVFHVFNAPLPWTEEELDGLDLGSQRLERRFGRMLAARWQKPGRSFASSFGTADGKAAYRFLENPHPGLGFESLLAPHQRQSSRRLAAESVVVLAQDTTTLSYNELHGTEGLGAIGDTRHPGRGLLLHSLHAVRPDGIPLGCIWAKLWARSPEPDPTHRNEQSIAEKESGRWLEAYQQARALAPSVPQTQLIVCGDRESDLFELFDQTEVAPPNLHLLVRAQHDRGLQCGLSLWESLHAVPSGGTLRVQVPRRTGQPARNAMLQLRWRGIEIAPPRVALKKSWQPIALYAVMAHEIDPPAGVQPIEWVLLTDWKVDSLKSACRMVRWYALRWAIECWHQVLKDVCGVETRQMKSASALERALVLDMIVAWRARLLCRLARQEPHLPASAQYAPEELQVLEAYRDKLPSWTLELPGPSPTPPREAESPKIQPPARLEAGSAAPTPPAKASSPLTLLQANVLVAMRGGYWGRKGDGPPGPRALARGLEMLAELVGYDRLVSPPPPTPTSRREPKRKPG